MSFPDISPESHKKIGEEAYKFSSLNAYTN